jgi:hypothetical protein
MEVVSDGKLDIPDNLGQLRDGFLPDVLLVIIILLGCRCRGGTKLAMGMGLMGWRRMMK